MRKPFEIRYLTIAVRDLEDIFDYITRDRPVAAAALLERFRYKSSTTHPARRPTVFSENFARAIFPLQIQAFGDVFPGQQ
jgi:plasmid stabilization system protein ParE